MPVSSPRGLVAASAEGFYIADEPALPLWQTPVGVFSVGSPNPAGEILAVLAPSDFRILAPGKALKRQKVLPGNLAPQSFHIRPAKDFLPSVLHGPHLELAISYRQGAV